MGGTLPRIYDLRFPAETRKQGDRGGLPIIQYHLNFMGVFYSTCSPVYPPNFKQAYKETHFKKSQFSAVQ